MPNIKIQCLKCKDKTVSKDVSIVKTDKRYSIKGHCSKCDTKQSQFISEQRYQELKQEL